MYTLDYLYFIKFRLSNLVSFFTNVTKKHSAKLSVAPRPPPILPNIPTYIIALMLVGYRKDSK